MILDYTEAKNTLISIQADLLEKGVALLDKALTQNKDKVVNVEPITRFIIGRAKTTGELARQGNTIDTAIIYRSLLETFIKFFYIVSPREDITRKQRLQEYWVDLPSIVTYNRANKIKQLLALSGIDAAKDPIRYGILPKQEEDRTEGKYRLKEKGNPIERKLKNDWSFGSIIQAIDSKDYTGIKALNPVDIRQEWVRASNFAHGDGYALRAIWSGEARHENSKEIVDMLLLSQTVFNSTMYLVWCVSLLEIYLTKNLGIGDFIQKTKADVMKGRQIASACVELKKQIDNKYPPKSGETPFLEDYPI